MLFNVPQFIDVEDKIAGPFTAKQLLWMFGMGAALLILWSVLEKAAFFVAAVPTVLLFLALAFYRPYKQPLIKFILHGFLFVFRPKLYVWKRIYEKPIKARHKEEEKPKETRAEKERKLTPENLEALARVLDSEGHERSEKIMEIIKQKQQQGNQAKTVGPVGKIKFYK